MKPYIFWVFVLISTLFVTGFTIDNAIVPQADILSGGPPKDGIPALLSPQFVRAVNADFMRPEDQVIGVIVSGQPRAYPIKILNWHEVVNDAIDDTPFVVTF